MTKQSTADQASIEIRGRQERHCHEPKSAMLVWYRMIRMLWSSLGKRTLYLLITNWKRNRLSVCADLISDYAISPTRPSSSKSCLATRGEKVKVSKPGVAAVGGPRSASPPTCLSVQGPACSPHPSGSPPALGSSHQCHQRSHASCSTGQSHPSAAGCGMP